MPDAANAAMNAAGDSGVSGWGARELAEAWLADTAFPDRTAEGYRHDTEEWLDHCHRHGQPWDRASPTHVALWAHRPGAANRATMRRISALQSFYAHALRRGAVVINPADAGPATLPLGPVAPSRLGARQVAAMLATLDGWGRDRRNGSDHPTRDRACGYLLVGMGLLSRQVVTLSLNDVDLGAGRTATLRVHGNADGSDIRTVPLPDLVREALAAYLPRRVTPRDAPDPGLLLTSKAGKRMPSHYPSTLLRAVAAACL